MQRIDTWIYKYRYSYIDCCSVARLCLTLFDLMECSPPGSSGHEISQAILEWVAISFFRGSVPAAWQTSSLTLSYVESPVLNIVLWTWIYTYW